MLNWMFVINCLIWHMSIEVNGCIFRENKSAIFIYVSHLNSVNAQRNEVVSLNQYTHKTCKLQSNLTTYYPAFDFLFFFFFILRTLRPITLYLILLGICQSVQNSYTISGVHFTVNIVLLHLHLVHEIFLRQVSNPNIYECPKRCASINVYT